MIDCGRRRGGLTDLPGSLLRRFGGRRQASRKVARWRSTFTERFRFRPMSAIITAERPDSADAVVLITELEALLDPLYPRESRHGLSVERLLAEAVTFFVLHSDGTPAACGGVKL